MADKIEPKPVENATAERSKTDQRVEETDRRSLRRMRRRMRRLRWF